jgi:hypothetical protein
MGCTPGATQACYDGPANTEGVGICKPGTQTCQMDHTYGPCTGAVKPLPTENCASGLDQNCDNTVTMCTGLLDTGRAFGSSGDDAANGVAVDSQGNAIVTGFFHGTNIDFGGMSLTTKDGGSDAFVVKYDTMGKVIWAQRLGDNGDDVGNAVAVDDKDNIYIAGTFEQKITFGSIPTFGGGHGIYVAKLDKDGNPVWAKGYSGDGASRHPTSISVDSAGNVAVVGNTGGNITFDGTACNSGGQTDYDGFLLYFDPAGMLKWVRQIRDGNKSFQILNGVTFDTSGNMVVTGQGTGDIDFGGGSQIVTQHGFLNNALFARYAPNGDATWTLVAGGDFDQQATGIAAGPMGSVFVTGQFSGAIDLGTGCSLSPKGYSDLFAAQLDANGAPVWCTQVSASFARVAGLAIAADAYGVVVTGTFDGSTKIGATTLTPGGLTDALVMKLAAKDGQVIWAQSISGMGYENPWGVAVTPLGAATVVGDFSYNIGVGAGTTPGNGGTDIFIAKLKP